MKSRCGNRGPSRNDGYQRRGARRTSMPPALVCLSTITTVTNITHCWMHTAALRTTPASVRRTRKPKRSG
ncbi:hypothetical protein KCP69_10120 [Salmonella enterica subsp. enterica]|nr:hypothetical protein KCP69_10120 [Salmonella enterica subsp. enterica]